MALSPINKMYCFEILGVLNTNSYIGHDGIQIRLNLIDLGGLRNAVLGYITANIDTDAVAQARVEAIIAEYIPISLQDGAMNGGNVGSLTQVTSSIESRIAVLRNRLISYIPVEHIAETAIRKQGPVAKQTSIPMYGF